MNKITRPPTQGIRSEGVKVNDSNSSLAETSTVSKSKSKLVKDSRIANSLTNKKDVELPKANKVVASDKNDSAASRAVVKFLMSLQQTVPDSKSALQQVEQINQNLIKLEQALANKGKEP